MRAKRVDPTFSGADRGPLLRLRDASYVSDGRVVVAPTSVDLIPGACVALHRSNPREAQILAMLAAGVARATHGSVLIGAYDPRVQPVHCKRIVGFVPHDPLPLGRWTFSRYVEYRAALWDLDAASVRLKATAILETLHGLHEAFAYPIAVALAASPELLVFDRPPVAYSAVIAAAAHDTATFSTHVSETAARAYCAADAQAVL